MAKAYQQLENEGVVYTLNKKGVFVNYRKDNELEKQEISKHIKEVLQKGKEIGFTKEEIEIMICELYEEDEYA